MFCTHCGRTVQEGASFCWNCGAALTAPGGRTASITPTGPQDAVASVAEATRSTAPAAALPASSAWGAFEAARPHPAHALAGGMSGSAGVSAPAGAGGMRLVGTGGTAPASGPLAHGASGRADAVDAGSNAAPIERSQLSGFWRRTWAAIIDSMLLGILMSPVYLLWLYPASMRFEGQDASEIDPTAAMAFLGTFLVFYVMSALVTWAYFALLESSAYQATLGKMALGIKVCDMNGRRLSTGKATARRVARMLSDFTFGIGYLMVLWTDRRQALHDKLTSTLVVRK